MNIFGKRITVNRISKSGVFILCMLLALAHLTINLTLAGEKKINPPNIVFILADDLGYSDIGAYGGFAKTPNLDRLADEGIKFSDFHSNGVVCSPTRAALLTGRHEQRMGIEQPLGQKVLGHAESEAKNEITIAQYLKKLGYTTGIFGKWHLGNRPESNPIHFGFDEFRGLLSGEIDYYSKLNRWGEPDWWYNDKLKHEEGYVTTLITDHAVRFIEENHSQPFFLYVPHLAIHFPW